MSLTKRVKKELSDNETHLLVCDLLPWVHKFLWAAKQHTAQMDQFKVIPAYIGFDMMSGKMVVLRVDNQESHLIAYWTTKEDFTKIFQAFMLKSYDLDLTQFWAVNKIGYNDYGNYKTYLADLFHKLDQYWKEVQSADAQ
jgi:hypothetical protein